jgi:crossover junction endodeoxyribonuclease RuvC
MHIAVDPGTLKAGVAVFDNDNLIDHIQVKVGNSKQPIAKRLLNLKNVVASFADRYKPEAIILEDGYAGRKNLKTSLVIAMSRGAVMIAAAENDVPVIRYAPKEIKKAFTGIGTADKEYMRKTAIIKYSLEIVGEDEADAIAIAYAHWFLSTASREETNNDQYT